MCMQDGLGHTLNTKEKLLRKETSFCFLDTGLHCAAHDDLEYTTQPRSNLNLHVSTSPVLGLQAQLCTTIPSKN